MASNSSSTKKMNVKEEPSNVQKLLASLQQAQNKTASPTIEQQPSTSTSKPPKKQAAADKKKKDDVKKKPKGQTVGARIQQQGEAARQLQQQQQQQQQQSKNRKQQTPRARLQSGPDPAAAYRGGPRIPFDTLELLEFKFISNMIESERRNIIRIGFNLELAHWYYIDHMVEDEHQKGLPNLGFREFTIQMYQHCKDLQKNANSVDELLTKFRDYKSTVPTYGAILLDEALEHVILVQSFFSRGNNWGFPKGKINQNEPPREAAIRETLEETGFDFGLYSEKEKKIQKFINDAMVRLYVVKNVPKDFPFQPQTRKEIRKIEWFKIDDLPSDKNAKFPAYLQGFKFYMALPFMYDLQMYVYKERDKREKRLEKGTPAAPVTSQAGLPTSSAGPSTSSAPPPNSSSIISQLFPHVPHTAEQTPLEPKTPTEPTYTRLTSQELFSVFKNQTGEESNVARPMLPDMSPAVNGMNSLEVLGLCTPLKPGASLNQFISVSPNCPMISEESGGQIDLFAPKNEPEIGFAMPTDLKQPLVTSEHPWQNNKSSEFSAPPQMLESHQGWLNTQLVNTIMHSPNPQKPSSNSPATPTTVLGHLIGKPIQPQPILPQAATPTALGSAEKPKSSRISLSDNSAFSAPKQSVPKPTAPPQQEKLRSSSLSGSVRSESRSKPARNLYQSAISPVSSGMRSVHGAEEVAGVWDEVYFREQMAATGDTSISSLAASNQELAMYNRETPVEAQNVFREQKCDTILPNLKPLSPCQHWKKPILIDKEYIAGPIEFWNQHFSMKTVPQ